MKHPSYWQTQFPDFEGLPPEIAAARHAGLIADESWHHDGCPSFCAWSDISKSIEDKRTLWVGYLDKAKRLEPDRKRFIVQLPDGAELAFDDENAALAALLGK